MPTPFRGYPVVSRLARPDGRGQVNALAYAVDADVARIAAGYRIGDILHYTSSDAFVKGTYPGIKAVLVECIGAGGGSGYLAATGASQVCASAGGGGGGYTRSWFSESDLAASETVTVGEGGLGGTSGSSDGGDGGDSSFGSLVTANGGGGGAGSSAPWAQNTASTIRLSGIGGGSSGDFVIRATGGKTGAVVWQTNSGDSVGGWMDLSGLDGAPAGGPYGSPGQRSVPATYPYSTAYTQTPATNADKGRGADGGLSIPSASASNGASGSDGLVVVTIYL